jgi:siroheme synthase-like protein
MRFPLFIDLSGRAAVVVGGGAVGLRRAGALARFGARVTVISPAVRDVPEGVAYVRRGYQEGDLKGAFLAVGATDCRTVNHAVFLEAKRRGVAVNVCDCPEECDFFFPALCETGGVVAGVAGDGGDHQKTARAAAIIRRAWEEEL